MLPRAQDSPWLVFPFECLCVLRSLLPYPRSDACLQNGIPVRVASLRRLFVYVSVSPPNNFCTLQAYVLTYKPTCMQRGRGRGCGRGCRTFYLKALPGSICGSRWSTGGSMWARPWPWPWRWQWPWRIGAGPYGYCTLLIPG